MILLLNHSQPLTLWPRTYVRRCVSYDNAGFPISGCKCFLIQAQKRGHTNSILTVWGMPSLFKNATRCTYPQHSPRRTVVATSGLTPSEERQVAQERYSSANTTTPGLYMSCLKFTVKTYDLCPLTDKTVFHFIVSPESPFQNL